MEQHKTFEQQLQEIEVNRIYERKRSIKLKIALLDQGMDWERKNKLKIYERIYPVKLLERSSLQIVFLDSVSTYNSSEVISYNDVVSYTVLTRIIQLNRHNIQSLIYIRFIQIQNIIQSQGTISF